MYKKVFRPFWSYDVEKTEKWLSSMAEKGYYFVKMNRRTRTFFFEQGEPRNFTYRMEYDKMRRELPLSLVEEGWRTIFQSGYWSVSKNEKPYEQIKSFPVREGIIKRNRRIMYSFGAIQIYLTVIALFNLTMLGIVLFQEGSINVEESPLWIITYTFLGMAITLWLLSFYSIIEINKSNKQLGSKSSYRPNKTEGGLRQEEEKKLRHSGLLVVKRKYQWMYSPDKLEKWLEKMEKQGYNLYRVSKRGTAFYFKLGHPRKISFCADYQNSADESYFNIHRDAGWKSVFISRSTFQKWSIWSREYVNGEEKPHIYTDQSDHLKTARKIAVTYSCLFLPLVAIYILNIGFMIEGVNHSGLEKIEVISIILLLFCIIMFGSMSIKTWLYYMRLRRHYVTRG
ncbi:DUF2812 domain-containing protein [bacterium LRH843]|nr:DUF2812 domain-containing protein [bacterium LRH843]